MKKLFFNAFLIASIVVLGTSCSKDKDNDDKTTAKVMVVHASPDAPNVDVYVNGAKSAITNLAFGSNSAYATLNTGNTNFKVAPTGTTNYVIDASANLEANKSYSVWAVNRVSNISAAVTVDDLTTPATGKAHIRFIHLSPDAPAVDILANGGAVFTNRSFADVTTNASVANFTPVDAGTYKLDVRVNGTTTIALSVPGVSLQSGKIYTIYAKGLLAGTGNQALGAQIIMNN